MVAALVTDGCRAPAPFLLLPEVESMSQRSLALALVLPVTFAAFAGCSAAGGEPSTRDGDQDGADGKGSASSTNDGTAPGASGSNGSNGSNGTSTGTASDGPVPVSTTLPAAVGGNPFTGATQYVRPDYVKQVEGSILKAPGDAALL